MKTTKKLILPGLLLALAGGVTSSALAGDETTPSTPAAPATPTQPETPATKTTKPVEQQLSGRVIAVDKATKTITIQVNSQTYVLQTGDNTKFNKSGKAKTLDDLIVGEEVSVTVALQESPSGRVEIAVVSVELPSGTEAQGGRGTAAGVVPPFVNLPNPANVGGNLSNVRSPSN